MRGSRRGVVYLKNKDTGPLEIATGIVVNPVGAFEESSVEVVLGSAEEERGSVTVLTIWRVFLVDLFHAVQQHGAIILQQT